MPSLKRASGTFAPPSFPPHLRLTSFFTSGSVRGTVRSQDKADKWEAKHPQYKGKIEWAIVKDIAEKGAFDEAIKGVTLVAHTVRTSSRRKRE